MTFTILFLGLLVLIPLVIGLSYVICNASERKLGLRERKPRNADPVTLDRNPEMPHRPGATS